MKRVYGFTALQSLENGLGFYPRARRKVDEARLSPQNLTLVPCSENLIDNSFTVTLATKVGPSHTVLGGVGLGSSSKDLFMAFWDNELLTNEDEHLLTEFTSSPSLGKNLLPFFTPSTALTGLIASEDAGGA